MNIASVPEADRHPTEAAHEPGAAVAPVPERLRRMESAERRRVAAHRRADSIGSALERIRPERDNIGEVRGHDVATVAPPSEGERALIPRGVIRIGDHVVGECDPGSGWLHAAGAALAPNPWLSRPPNVAFILRLTHSDVRI